MRDTTSEDHLRPARSRLSKSKFLSGLQCHKRLYLEITQPELAEPPDPTTQALLAMGTEIGRLAQRRFPGGVQVAPALRPRDAAIALTAMVEEFAGRWFALGRTLGTTEIDQLTALCAGALYASAAAGAHGKNS